MAKIRFVEQADGTGKGHTQRKVLKRRAERHRAKRNPECTPAYGRYKGYQL